VPSQKNIDQLNILKDKLDKAKSVVFADHSGLSVTDQTQLRSDVAEAGGEFTVAKNTLLILALKDKLGDLPSDLKDALQGPTSVLFSNTDAIASLKALDTFTKAKELPTLKLGIMPASSAGGKYRILSLEEVKQLATLPTKDELIARLVSQLNAPRAGLVSVLGGNLRKLVYSLKAIKDKQSN